MPNGTEPSRRCPSTDDIAATRNSLPIPKIVSHALVHPLRRSYAWDTLRGSYVGSEPRHLEVAVELREGVRVDERAGEDEDDPAHNRDERHQRTQLEGETLHAIDGDAGNEERHSESRRIREKQPGGAPRRARRRGEGEDAAKRWTDTR